MSTRFLIAAVLAPALLLAGCKARPADKLDEEILNANDNQTDAALANALGDEIIVDPALSQQRDGKRKSALTTQPGGTDCYANVAYNHGWANRLPAGVPLPADAAVSEAAGNDLPGCRIRAVSYSTKTPVAALIPYYVGETRRAGFAADYERREGELVVGGDRPDGTAFYLTASPRAQGGSDVDLVANNGR